MQRATTACAFPLMPFLYNPLTSPITCGRQELCTAHYCGSGHGFILPSHFVVYYSPRMYAIQRQQRVHCNGVFWNSVFPFCCYSSRTWTNRCVDEVHFCSFPFVCVRSYSCRGLRNPLLRMLLACPLTHKRALRQAKRRIRMSTSEYFRRPTADSARRA